MLYTAADVAPVPSCSTSCPHHHTPTCHDDWHSPYDIILPPPLRDADSVGVITDVHQRAHHYLIVDGALHSHGTAQGADISISSAGSLVLLTGCQQRSHAPVQLTP